MDYPFTIESGFRGRKTGTIQTPGTHTTAYYIDYRTTAFTITIHKGDSASAPTIGRVTFHSLSSTIDIAFLHPVTQTEDLVAMKQDSLLSLGSTYSLPLPAAGAAFTPPFCWKVSGSVGSVLKGGGLKCEDARGSVLAMYAFVSGWGKGNGALRVEERGLQEGLLDQVVVSFLTMEEGLRRRRGKSANVSDMFANAAGAG
jgi:hypothetical protein